MQAAVNYNEAYSEEIKNAIAEASATDHTAIKRLLPQTELISVPLRVVE